MRYNFPQHYSSWKVNFNPIGINSVSSNSWKFAKTSQIIKYEIYMFIYIKKLLDRVLVLTCSVSNDLPGCRPAPEGGGGTWGSTVLRYWVFFMRYFGNFNLNVRFSSFWLTVFGGKRLFYGITVPFICASLLIQYAKQNTVGYKGQ